MNNLLTQSFELAKIQRPKDGEKEFGSSSSTVSSDLEMDAFFKQVMDIEGQIDNIAKQLHKLQSSNEASKHTTKASEMKAIKLQMEKDIDEVGKITLKAKKSVEELDGDNLANRRKPGCEKGTGVDRSRHAMTMTLKMKLKDRLGDFHTLRKEIHDDYRDTIKRRFFTVTGMQPDEETIDKLVETGDGEQIFAKAIQGNGRGQIMDTMAEIHERRETVLEIEKRLTDLQQMFLDLSILVDAQGDMLNDIEAQVSRAVDHVQAATETLRVAKKKQKSSRKFMCLSLLLFTIIVILILIPLLKGMLIK